MVKKQTPDVIHYLQTLATMIRTWDPESEASVAFDLGTGQSHVQMKLVGGVDGIFELLKHREYWSRVGDLGHSSAFSDSGVRTPIFKRQIGADTREAGIHVYFLMARDMFVLATLLVRQGKTSEANAAILRADNLQRLLFAQVVIQKTGTPPELWREQAAQLSLSLGGFQQAAQFAMRNWGDVE